MRGTPDGPIQQGCWPCSSEEQSEAALMGEGLGLHHFVPARLHPTFHPKPHPSSTMPMMSKLSIKFAQVLNYQLSPGPFKWQQHGSAHVLAEKLTGLHFPSWDFKLLHSSWLPSTLIKFGLLSCLHYLMQRLYKLTLEAWSQSHKLPHVILNSINL